ncbi:MAG: hypothetical protein C4554_04250 [Dethiobacter sp.]|jgi:hypothetical protein|nr:MAG: hypothetical protein C4554_04250 [Dethiobacter sp.]
MTAEVKYFYGLISSGEERRFNIEGIECSQKVYTISFKDISAVVSDTGKKIFDPDKENVIAHQAAISKVMEEYTIIPARFGTVFSSADDVQVFLQKIYSTAKDVFRKINNKVEMGLKVFWKEETFQKQVNSNEINQLKAKINNAEDNRVYYLKMQLGELVEKIMEANRTYYLEEIYHKLAVKAGAAKLNEIIGIKMVFNAAYLVEKDKVEDFNLYVEKIVKVYKDTLDFIYSGPWPPYNFTTIKIMVNSKDN